MLSTHNLSWQNMHSIMIIPKTVPVFRHYEVHGEQNKAERRFLLFRQMGEHSSAEKYFRGGFSPVCWCVKLSRGHRALVLRNVLRKSLNTPRHNIPGSRIDYLWFSVTTLEGNRIPGVKTCGTFPTRRWRAPQRKKHGRVPSRLAVFPVISHETAVIVCSERVQ